MTAQPKMRKLPTARAVSALALREMSVSYGRSAGGYIWAILEPVTGVLLLTLIFSQAFESPPLGHSFALFYASGLVPFLAYLDVSGKVSQSLNFSRPLLIYPALNYCDALFARLILNMATQTLIGCLIFLIIIITFETRAVLAPEKFFLVFAMLASLSFAVGVINCVLISLFPLWQQVWAIINRPLLLVSCVFFLFDSVPKPFQDWLWWNPIIHIIGQARSSFYPGYSAEYVMIEYVLGSSIALTAFGFVFLHRYHREIINE